MMAIQDLNWLGKMIIDCISDLHGFKPSLQGGDLLIVAGDLTARDTMQEHVDFLWWLDEQPYEKKIYIAGNHDGCIQKDLRIKDGSVNRRLGAICLDFRSL